MSVCLSEEEIRELTKKKQHAAQRRALVTLGIEHRARPDGSLVVSRSHAEEILGARKAQKQYAPDFDAMQPKGR